MTLEANAAFGRARPWLSLAGAALAAALLASPAFAGCGSTGVGTNIHPPSVSTGVHSGVYSASASTGAGGGSSPCANGISNATKTGSLVAPAGGSATGNTQTHFAHQNFKFQGKSSHNMGPHRHNA